MALTPDKLFVLIVALLTWGTVFVYMIRLDKIAKKLEEEVRARELDAPRVSAP